MKDGLTLFKISSDKGLIDFN